MGIDICHYADHDLQTESVESFVNELKKRVNSEKIIVTIGEDYNSTLLNEENDVWHIYYQDENNIDVYCNQLEFAIHKKVLDVFNVKINNQIDILRWNKMVNNFENDLDNATKWLNGTLAFLRQNVVPIFHSTKLLILADSFSDRHCDLFDYMIDNGKTIDEALEYNQSFEIPCKVYKNHEALGIKESDYWDGDFGPIFLFDL